jgi:hypothetical protein
MRSYFAPKSQHSCFNSSIPGRNSQLPSPELVGKVWAGNIHESIINSNDIDLPVELLELVWVGEVAWDVGFGAAGREGGWDTDDQAGPAGELVGEVDFVAGVLAEELDARDGVADFNL